MASDAWTSAHGARSAPGRPFGQGAPRAHDSPDRRALVGDGLQPRRLTPGCQLRGWKGPDLGLDRHGTGGSRTPESILAGKAESGANCRSPGVPMAGGSRCTCDGGTVTTWQVATRAPHAVVRGSDQSTSVTPTVAPAGRAVRCRLPGTRWEDPAENLGRGRPCPFHGNGCSRPSRRQFEPQKRRAQPRRYSSCVLRLVFDPGRREAKRPGSESGRSPRAGNCSVAMRKGAHSVEQPSVRTVDGWPRPGTCGTASHRSEARSRHGTSKRAGRGCTWTCRTRTPWRSAPTADGWRRSFRSPAGMKRASFVSLTP